MWRDYYGGTLVHPFAAGILGISLVANFLIPRRWLLAPFLVVLFFIPTAQRVSIAGLDLQFARIIGLALLLRVLLLQEYRSIRWGRADAALGAWLLIGTVVFSIGRGQGLVTYLGRWLDIAPAYLVARVAIQSREELHKFVWLTAILTLPVAVFFFIEFVTGRNVFSVFGGVQEYSSVRDGRLRCQAAFGHPILAGTLWAVLGSVFVGSWLGRRSAWAAIAVALAAFIIVASASSTPVLAVAGIALAWCLYPLRRFIGSLCLIALLGAVVLHFIMEAPIWHLVARVSAVGGSTGYHRYVLIDSAIRFVGEWWLLGTERTSHWNSQVQTFDVANQYVLEGVEGGVWRLAAFFYLIWAAFSSVGRAIRFAVSAGDRFLVWGFGAALFGFCLSFIGVSPFGQMVPIWFIWLGVCAGLPQSLGTVHPVLSSVVAGRRPQRAGLSTVGCEVHLKV